MIEIIKEIIAERKYVCIYTNNTKQDKFIYGRIIGADEVFLAILMVSQDGLYDGIAIMEIERVLRIEESVSYNDKMVRLMRIRGYAEKEISVDETDILSWGINLVVNKKSIVSVELCGSEMWDVVGIMDSITGNNCKVNCVDEYGLEDGVSFIELRDITQICFESEDENRISVLWKDRKENG